MNIATDFLVFDDRKETDLEGRISTLAHSIGVTGWMKRDSVGDIYIHAEAAEKVLMHFTIALTNELAGYPLKMMTAGSYHYDSFKLDTDANRVNLMEERV